MPVEIKTYIQEFLLFIEKNPGAYKDSLLAILEQLKKKISTFDNSPFFKMCLARIEKINEALKKEPAQDESIVGAWCYFLFFVSQLYKLQNLNKLNNKQRALLKKDLEKLAPHLQNLNSLLYIVYKQLSENRFNDFFKQQKTTEEKHFQQLVGADFRSVINLKKTEVKSQLDLSYSFLVPALSQAAQTEFKEIGDRLQDNMNKELQDLHALYMADLDKKTSVSRWARWHVIANLHNSDLLIDSEAKQFRYFDQVSLVKKSFATLKLGRLRKLLLSYDVEGGSIDDEVLANNIIHAIEEQNFAKPDLKKVEQWPELITAIAQQYRKASHTGYRFLIRKFIQATSFIWRSDPFREECAMAIDKIFAFALKDNKLSTTGQLIQAISRLPNNLMKNYIQVTMVEKNRDQALTTREQILAKINLSLEWVQPQDQLVYLYALVRFEIENNIVNPQLPELFLKCVSSAAYTKKYPINTIEQKACGPHHSIEDLVRIHNNLLLKRQNSFAGRLGWRKEELKYQVDGEKLKALEAQCQKSSLVENAQSGYLLTEKYQTTAQEKWNGIKQLLKTGVNDKYSMIEENGQFKLTVPVMDTASAASATQASFETLALSAETLEQIAHHLGLDAARRTNLEKMLNQYDDAKQHSDRINVLLQNPKLKLHFVSLNESLRRTLFTSVSLADPDNRIWIDTGKKGMVARAVSAIAGPFGFIGNLADYGFSENVRQKAVKLAGITKSIPDMESLCDRIALRLTELYAAHIKILTDASITDMVQYTREKIISRYLKNCASDDRDNIPKLAEKLVQLAITPDDSQSTFTAITQALGLATQLKVDGALDPENVLAPEQILCKPIEPALKEAVTSPVKKISAAADKKAKRQTTIIAAPTDFRVATMLDQENKKLKEEVANLSKRLTALEQQKSTNLISTPQPSLVPTVTSYSSKNIPSLDPKNSFPMDDELYRSENPVY